MATLGDVGAGHALGRYELLTPIAQGGMALVWAARMRGSRNFQKIVAVKTMLPQLSDDPEFERMFLSEAELTARLKHPNVCEVLDLGEEDGTLYIVMEWVNGESLSTLIRAASAAGKPIPVGVTVALMRDAALGLHAAHELRGDDGTPLGLVHRDVSPQNILVTVDGRVKIVDFGIAKATAQVDGGVQTQAGQMKGKIPYMAPEQPLQRAIDRRTDVFALGTLLQLMVTGKHPFRGKDEMATLRHLCDPKPLPRASTLVPGLSPRLDAVIARAVEKSPAKRFQTMAELAEALEGARRELKDADVAAFVTSVVGGRLTKRAAVIREARRLADARGGAPAVPESDTPGAIESRAQRTETAPALAAPPVAPEPEEASVTAPPSTSTPPPSVVEPDGADAGRRRRWVRWIGVTVAGAALAAMAVLSMRGPTSRQAAAPPQTPALAMSSTTPPSPPRGSAASAPSPATASAAPPAASSAPIAESPPGADSVGPGANSAAPAATGRPATWPPWRGGAPPTSGSPAAPSARGPKVADPGF